MLEAIRLEEPWCHPSSPWDAQEASSRVQSKKRPLWSSTQSMGASFDPDTLGKARTIEAKDARQDAPKTTWLRSLTSSDEFTRRYCSHQYSAQPQKEIAVYFWIFKSSMKFRFQRIKNQLKRSFPQEVMAKTSKVVHSEIFWTARSAKVKRS